MLTSLTLKSCLLSRPEKVVALPLFRFVSLIDGSNCPRMLGGFQQERLFFRYDFSVDFSTVDIGCGAVQAIRATTSLSRSRKHLRVSLFIEITWALIPRPLPGFYFVYFRSVRSLYLERSLISPSASQLFERDSLFVSRLEQPGTAPKFCPQCEVS